MRIFNYPGCKISYSDFINSKISEIENVNTFVEPFCGTASISLNLNRKFNDIIINDNSKSVIRIIKSFRDGSFNQLFSMYKEIENNFGNIRESKEAYYNFRNSYNKKYFNTDTIEEGFFLYIVSKATINSLFRIGPNGFNNSFGNRGNKISLSEYDFNEIKYKLLSYEILNTDYLEIIKKYDSINTLFFLDPPYVERMIQGSYETEKSFDKNKFIDVINNIKGKIIYTDVYSDLLMNKLNDKFTFEQLRDKKTIRPGKTDKSITNYIEGIFIKK